MVAMEERVSRLEGAYEQVDERLGDLTTAVASLRTEMNALRSDMDARFDAQRAEISALRAEVNNRLNVHVTLMAVGIVTIVGSIFGALFIS